jgi:enoyl-CoA hydratase/carnithine racemase
VTLVQVEDRDGVAVVILDRPPANALEPGLVADGLAALETLRTTSPGAVVLTGGGSFFSGGADLRVVPRLSPDDQAELARRVNQLFEGWHTFPRPVVSAVNGHAVAGGLVLALCGDWRVAAAGGRYGLTEVKAGIPFPSAAMAVVRAELDPRVLRRLALRAELVDGFTAVELGLFDEVVEAGSVVDRALAVAAELAALPPRTFEHVKRRLRSPAAPVEASPFGGAEAAAAVSSEAVGGAGRILGDG